MSKYKAVFGTLAGLILLILQLINNCFGQSIDLKILVDPAAGSALVSGDLGGGRAQELTFLNSYGSVRGLHERISQVKSGNGEALKQAGPGRFRAAEPLRAFSYQAELKPQQTRFAAAHTSWITPAGALIFADDLLPQFSRSVGNVSVTLVLPEGWSVSSSESGTNGKFMVRNLETAVFFLAPSPRTNITRSGNTEIAISTAGEWLFTDKESSDMAKSILAEYRNNFGDPAGKRIQINLIKFPWPVNSGAWEADTRGSTLTIVSSDMPFKSQSIQRLHEQLRHELFHLWVPGDLVLTGSYDWFYEGFAMYRSLRTAVELNQIRFEDMLDTLSRAGEIDTRRDNSVSLLEASNGRWTGGNDQVYARGLLVAFLTDLAMIRSTGGKRDSAELIRDLLSRYADKGVNGSDAVIDVMRAHPELVQIIERYIAGNENVDWPAAVRDTGLQTQSTGSGFRLTVVPSPAGKQKAILDKLGYNSWRKLTTKKQ